MPDKNQGVGLDYQNKLFVVFFFRFFLIFEQIFLTVISILLTRYTQSLKFFDHFLILIYNEEIKLKKYSNDRQNLIEKMWGEILSIVFIL